MHYESDANLYAFNNQLKLLLLLLCASLAIFRCCNQQRQKDLNKKEQLNSQQNPLKSSGAVRNVSEPSVSPKKSMNQHASTREKCICRVDVKQCNGNPYRYFPLWGELVVHDGEFQVAITKLDNVVDSVWKLSINGQFGDNYSLFGTIAGNVDKHKISKSHCKGDYKIDAAMGYLYIHTDTVDVSIYSKTLPQFSNSLRYDTLGKGVICSVINYQFENKSIGGKFTVFNMTGQNVSLFYDIHQVIFFTSHGKLINTSIIFEEGVDIRMIVPPIVKPDSSEEFGFQGAVNPYRHSYLCPDIDKGDSIVSFCVTQNTSYGTIFSEWTPVK